MGNGNSQSVLFSPPPPSRFHQPHYASHGVSYPHDNRGIPKYAHPHNRVLPKPVAGQRLRSTDNGSILQTAGTIRGLRAEGTGVAEPSADSEMMGILRKRSEMIEKENDCYHQLNLRNHRMFHSDPNISRRPNEESPEHYGGGGRRNCNGGAAMRSSKLKYKKKAKAPQPPSSLPRQLERNSSADLRGRKGAAECKCIAKTRAPQPPSIVVIPPPPPLPDAVTTRTGIGPSTLSTVTKGNVTQDSHLGRHHHHSTSETTRTVECNAENNRATYEKNVQPLEKWRNYRSAGDVRIDEDHEGFPSSSRTTVFDSKKLSEHQQGGLPAYLPQKPDPFQKEIREVTKKIAENRQYSKPNSPSPLENNSHREPSTSVVPETKETISPPRFYFADPSICRSIQKPLSSGHKVVGTKIAKSNDDSPSKITRQIQNEPRAPGISLKNTIVDEIVPSLERFSPTRRRFRSPSPASSPGLKTTKDWDHLSKSLLHKKDMESNIDIKLRPVLPRKLPEVPTTFSPSEAWNALGSDGFGSSNQSTSDDGHEFTAFRQFRSKVEPGMRQQRRHSEADFHLWTPRQDLLDDSDACSEESEEAVVPRIRPASSSNDIGMRFSLPSVMFSNMRPIGSEGRSNSAHSSYAKQTKKKPDSNGPTNFRRFLSKRNRFMSEEDISTTVDSNWTFGQQGLQKRGKQYSSELMLSDKKRNEWMAKNDFSDLLGDILVSKADHMRRQMRSSESGNSNFSFYSTEGQVMFLPEKDNFRQGQGLPSDSPRGRVQDIRQRFDRKVELPSSSAFSRASKKKAAEMDMNRRRDMELAKMLEDEVRKRRNKEKISIRQQLQRLKDFHSEEEDEFDDEAYFTEPKSRESPFFSPMRASTSDLEAERFMVGPPRSVTALDSSRLSHWQSSPALLEDTAFGKNAMHPSAKGRLSLSSVMSSPDSGIQRGDTVDSWLSRQRPGSKGTSGDGDISSSPTPAPPPKKEKRKTNIYKQLMDIVKKEERHLRNAQGSNGDPNQSRDSSCSQRESSSSSACSDSSSSSCTYSDSSSKRGGGGDVPANREFGFRAQPPPFQVAFVQPYSPHKSYRPVPFVPSPYRLPGLKEEAKHVHTEIL